MTDASDVERQIKQKKKKAKRDAEKPAQQQTKNDVAADLPKEDVTQAYKTLKSVNEVKEKMIKEQAKVIQNL